MSPAEFRLSYLRLEDGSTIRPVVVAQTRRQFENWCYGRGLRTNEFIYLSDGYAVEGVRPLHIFLLSTYRDNAVWKNESVRQYIFDTADKFYYCSIRGTMTPWQPK